MECVVGKIGKRQVLKNLYFMLRNLKFFFLWNNRKVLESFKYGSSVINFLFQIILVLMWKLDGGRVIESWDISYQLFRCFQMRKDRGLNQDRDSGDREEGYIQMSCLIDDCLGWVERVSGGNERWRRESKGRNEFIEFQSWNGR